MKRPCVFLDRDGTLCEDKVYLSDPEGLVIFPGVPEGIRGLKEAGFHVIVVTNQSGIGRGYFEEETLKEIHQRLEEILQEKGAEIDAIYYCPHHPDENCDCRKPKTGLVKKALQDFEIDLGRSFIIGDTVADVELGKKMGLKTILVWNEEGGGEVPPDFIAKDFQKAVQWILKADPRP